MKLFGAVPIANLKVDADPIAAPGSVLDTNVVGHDGYGPIRDRTVTQRLFLAYDAGAPGQQTTVEVYAADDRTTNLPKVQWKWYLVAGATVLTHRTFASVGATVPAQGPFYVRQTAGTTVGVVSLCAQDG
jgi:hypothetical protein